MATAHPQFRLAPGLTGEPLTAALARLSGALPLPSPSLRRPPVPSLRYPAIGPRFDVAVDPGGYAWWYLDATSDDGRFGLTIIAFIGSVFSPYYRADGRRAPEDHCAINVSLTGPHGSVWTMTERGVGAVTRDAQSFVIGPSALHWDGESLVILIEERGAPLPRAVRGMICVRPESISPTGFHLDPAGRHRWHPIAPRARVSVAMAQPGMSWRGDGYLDSNFGEEPLEDGFRDWHWARAHCRKDVAVMYEGRRRDGTPFELALRMDRQGRWHDVSAPPRAPLPSGAWGVQRMTRADPGATPRLLRSWVDAPFYCRSAIATRLDGEDVRAVHESLCLRRFTLPVVQAMLPWRMPRRA